jgi:hypothetical protein
MTFALLALLLASAELRIEVTVAKGLLDKPTDGRMLVVLGAADDERPYRTIGGLGPDAPPVIGADASGFASGKVAVLTGSSLAFPCGTLGKVKAGRYRVQALFDHSRDIRLPKAPGNLLSKAVEAEIDPEKGGVVRLELTDAIPEVTEKPRSDLRYIKLRSEALSKFWGRDITLRAGLMLPAGWETDKESRYPLRVHIGGFGSRYSHIAGMRQAGEKEPRFLTLMLDGAGPLGDPYQVNSDGHGPWGDAVTKELIPHVEKEYRGNGRRVTDGASTGGWVSLALQVFYPDFFSGCWSHCPDPVDFRSFQLMNLYDDDNAYVNPTGFERPSMRTLDGDTVHTVRHEVLLERVLGRGGRWELSGRDWASWNATFGLRGKDGPVPLWDGETGKLDPAVVEAMKRYDLRRKLEAEWTTLGPKLRGKVRVYVGDADEYFLNNAVERLKAFFDRARPAYEGKVEFARRRGHNWRALTDRQMLEEMAAAVR